MRHREEEPGIWWRNVSSPMLTRVHNDNDSHHHQAQDLVGFKSRGWRQSAFTTFEFSAARSIWMIWLLWKTRASTWTHMDSIACRFSLKLVRRDFLGSFIGCWKAILQLQDFSGWHNPQATNFYISDWFEPRFRNYLDIWGHEVTLYEAEEKLMRHVVVVLSIQSLGAGDVVQGMFSNRPSAELFTPNTR